MSQERKDVRFKVHPGVHHCLVALAETEGKDISAYVEELVNKEIDRRIHQATVLSSRANEVGLPRKRRD